MMGAVFRSTLFPLLLAVFLIAVVSGAPVETPDSAVTEKPDCNSEHSDFYDQRQNGTENYRIHLKGVVVLVAPAETVLQAAQMAQLESDLNLSEGTGLKPEPRPPSPSQKAVLETHDFFPHTQQTVHQPHHTKEVKGSINQEVEDASTNLRR